MFFKLPVVITKQNKRFVAYSPALDISTAHKTEKGAKSRFEELVNLFMEEIVEAGTVDDVLYELGWKKVQKKWNPPTVVSSNLIDTRVPSLV